MEPVLSVTQLVTAINFTLESLANVTVVGEVDDFKIIQGKWVTFALKDEESTVNCFMPVWQYRAQIENGMLVKAVGQPKVRNKGFFSFVLAAVAPEGEGSLRRALQLLEEKLKSEGLFDPDRKRTLPAFPQHIALITSRDAAAYSDFIKVLQGRLGGLTISFIHTGVQGEDAPRQIVDALTTANSELKDIDVIVLVRGGGSLEDLMAFNDEYVVRAVAASRTPIIVGIGHERDVTLAELAADVRASTPSNAAELVVQSRQEIMSDIEQKRTTLSEGIYEALRLQQEKTRSATTLLRTRLTNTVHQVTRRIDALAGMKGRFLAHIAQQQESITSLTRTLTARIHDGIHRRSQELNSITRVLQTLSPQATLKRGYSITRGQDGLLIRSVADVQKNTALTTTVLDGEIHSTVTDTLKKSKK